MKTIRSTISILVALFIKNVTYASVFIVPKFFLCNVTEM